MRDMTSEHFKELCQRLSVGENIVQASHALGYWIVDIAEFLYWRESDLMTSNKNYLKSLNRQH